MKLDLSAIELATSIDPKLFSKTYPFAGSFEGEGNCSSPLSIEVRVSDVNAHPPTGVIMGNRGDYERLENFFVSRRGECSLRSNSSASDREEFRAERVMLRRIDGRNWPDDEASYIYQPIGFFEMDEITISLRRAPARETKRILVFNLTGDGDVWPSFHLRSMSYLGNTKTRIINSALRIYELKDARVKVRPHFVQPLTQHLENLEDPHRSIARVANRDCDLLVEASRPCLEITDLSVARSDDEFIIRATDIADRLCLIGSFLAKSRVDWYARQLWSSTRFETKYRNVEERRSHSSLRDDGVIDYKHLRRFISKSFSNCPSAADEMSKSRLPILSYVAGVQETYIEEKFIALFRSLEMLVGEAKIPAPPGLPGAQKQELIRKSVAEALQSNKIKEPYSSSALAKLRNLFSQNFRWRVARYLKLNRIDYDDLGGDRGLSSLLALRNELIHGAREPSVRRMIRETARLETIVQRALLRRFGWKGEDRTPTYDNSHSLTLAD